MDRTEQLNETDYHLCPDVGSTGLKTVLKSLGHFKYRQDNPLLPTKAMNFGTCFHLAALEPKRFRNEVVVMPEFKGTGMYAKKDQWLTENDGKLVISADEMADLLLMLKSLSAHPAASSLLVGGVPELSYFWEDPETGVGCKARPDFRRAGGSLVDIKTTGDASLEEFSRSVLKYGYHISAAHYLNGVSRVLGQTFETFLILAIEKEAPYGCQVFEIDFGTLEKGRELCSRALVKLHDAMNTGNYPAYSQEIVPINIPAYGFGL
jgi:hypothetical protein